MSQKQALKILIILEVIALFVVGGFAIYRKATKETDTTDYSEISKEREEGGEFVYSEEDEFEFVESRIHFSDKVEEKLASMTLEEKVAQLFIVSPESIIEDFEGTVTVSGEMTRGAIDAYPVGGLLYSGDNLQTADQIWYMLNNVNQYSLDRIDLPMFRAIEEEGGNQHNPLLSALLVENQPSANELGATGNTDLVRSNVQTRIGYLDYVGFNMLIGPLADLTTGDDDFDERSYGSNSIDVAEMIETEISAYNSSDILAVLKYFPYAAENKESSLDELNTNELLVFQSAINENVKCIMVGNVISHAITGSNSELCSMSENTVDVLRSRMGYDGILMSASLKDERVVNVYSSGEAAVKCINAGMDIIYNPENFFEAFSAVVNAVNNGEVSIDRLENAVGRIINYKLSTNN